MENIQWRILKRFVKESLVEILHENGENGKRHDRRNMNPYYESLSNEELNLRSTKELPIAEWEFPSNGIFRTGSSNFELPKENMAG